MLSYANRVKQLACTLRSMEEAVDEKEIAMAVLHGPPPRHDTWVVALDALGSKISCLPWIL